jgi:hypothetical protein
MKKLLLSFAVIAAGFTAANAEQYTIFGADNQASLDWKGDANGYTTTVTVGGKNFTISTVKAKSTTNLIQPGDQIRVYKNADIVISSSDFDFKTVVLTSTGGNYGNEQTVSEGWAQKYDATAKTLTISSTTAAKTVTMSATANQFRVVNIVVSDGEVQAEPEPEAVKVANVAETKALETGTKIAVDYALTVGFVKNSNVFACDAAGDFIQLYGSNSLKAGDVIPAGWEGTYKLYNGTTPEIEFSELPAAAEGTFTPAEVAAADVTVDLVNSVVLVKGVVFAEATPATKSNFEGTVGETTLSFRNNYTLDSVEAGTYDVTFVVTIYNKAPSLYVVNYAASQSSGIDEIEAAGAEAVYYNLQGVRVDNPANGIFIVRRGDKVTKEAIR